MKKKLTLFMLAMLTCVGGFAQVDARYGLGAVPVVNNHVTFEQTISIPEGLDVKWAFAIAQKWAAERFVEPTVISCKTIEQDDTNYHMVLLAEEYIVFRKRWFELDRSRINYLLEIAPAEKGITLRMTRIKYWYEEERNGGQRFTAEEWITDDQCFNASKTKLLRATGKFRIKTIDLFKELVSELDNRI